MRHALMRLVLVVLVPLLVVEAGILATWYHTRRSGQEEANLEAARGIAAAFEDYVQHIRRPELAIGEALAGLQPYTNAQATAYLTTNVREFLSVRTWNWLDPEGKVIASSSPRAVGLNLADRAYFQKLRSGQPWAISDLLTERTNGLPIFVIARRVNDEKGKLFGIVSAVVEPSEFATHISELRHGGPGTVSIFDRQGVRVYDSDKRQSGHEDCRGQDPLLKAVLDSRAERSDVLRLPADNEDYLVARVPIKGIGWVAGARRPVREVMADVYAGLWIAGGMNLLVAVGSGLLAVKTSGGLIRQLRRLQSHADAIAHGDLEHRTEITGVRELAELATAFNRMGTAVHDARQELEAANAALEQRVRERTAQLAATIRRLESEVAERLRIGQELRTASLYARGLIEASLDPLVTISPEGKVTDVNEATIAATGVPRERLVGSDFSDYFTEPERAREGYRKVLSDGLVHDYPLTIRHADGRTTDVLYNAVVYRNEAGEVQGVFAAARDVTERLRAEKELQQYRAHLEELVQQRTEELRATNVQLEKEAAERKRAAEEAERLATFPRLNPNPITEMDLEGRVGYLNPSAEQLFPDLPQRQLAHPWLADWEQVVLALRESNAQVCRREVMVGEQCFLQTIHYSQDTGQVRIYGVEITDRKQAEESLKQTAEQLARSNEELEQFAYVASHDLQEPLRVISGYVQLIEHKYKGRLDADADQFIYYIVDGATRMRQLITDLLDYSRVSTRGKPLQPTNLQNVLERVLADLKGVIEESGAVLKCGPLPTVRGDEIQLIRLFQNLIANAIKFRSGRPPEIDVSASRDGDHWTLAVRDNGIGIERQYWERIFVIFQRLHTRQKYPGTGIGLAICKRIVERHGGTIWLDSRPGQGTTFFFTLP